MVHREAYDGTRRLRRACLRKEERNKCFTRRSPDLYRDVGEGLAYAVPASASEGNRLCRSSCQHIPA